MESLPMYSCIACAYIVLYDLSAAWPRRPGSAQVVE